MASIIASGAFTQTLGEQSLEQGRGAPRVPDLAQISTNQQTISLSEPKHAHRSKEDGKLLLQFGKEGAGAASKEKSRGTMEGCCREEKESR
jgi:hypothetical protein